MASKAVTGFVFAAGSVWLGCACQGCAPCCPSPPPWQCSPRRKRRRL